MHPRKIPERIHFIWLGSPLPKKYFHSLRRVAILARVWGFEFNLWVDDASNYTKAAIREEMEIPGIRVRKFGELIENMRKDPFYATDEKWHMPEQKMSPDKSVMPAPVPLPQEKLAQFIYFLDLELTGHRNLAAASDLLRYEIMRQEGGYYFDTDIEFDIDKIKQLIADTPAHGILLLCTVLGGSLNDIDNISSRLKHYAGGQDILGSLPDHPVLKQTINDSLRNYIKLHTAEYQSEFFVNKDHFLANVKLLGFYPKEGCTGMDVKRYPIWHGDPDGISNGNVIDQAYLQIYRAAGPSTFLHALADYMRPLGAGKEFGFFSSVSVCDTESSSDTQGRIAGIPVTRKSDKNWLRKKKISHALDTSSYPHRLFTPAPRAHHIKRAEKADKNNNVIEGFSQPCNIL